MIVLGISGYYHDAAAVLLKDGEVLGALQEERVSGIKGDAQFPLGAIEALMRMHGINWREIDQIAWYEQPFLKFERLLETTFTVFPGGLRFFMQWFPEWMKGKLFLKRTIKKEIKKIGGSAFRGSIIFSEHHLSHALSAFVASGFDEAAVLCIDGVGEWSTCTLWEGNNGDLRLIKEMRYPHSLGLVYSTVTHYLGFKINSGEYKVMGLAPYANRSSFIYKQCKNVLKEMVQWNEDGSIWVSPQYFRFHHLKTFYVANKWKKLLGFSPRIPESEIQEHHIALAAAMQDLLNEAVLKLALMAKQLTGKKQLCMAGGVALNCTSNSVIQDAGIFEEIFIQPAAGDSGAALGAGWYAERKKMSKNAFSVSLGRSFSNHEIEKALTMHEYPITYQLLEREELIERTAGALCERKVIGWFRGREEWGPRALGNRSILASPMGIETQARVNQKIKFREDFRPFAPVVLEEEKQEYFDMKYSSPFMLFIYKIKEKYRSTLSADYFDLDWKNKLAVDRSIFQAICHVDFSARVQTVNAHQNKDLCDLLLKFKQFSGHPILLNTSFNVRKKPMVGNVADAINCFLQTDMDVLVLENYWIQKADA